MDSIKYTYSIAVRLENNNLIDYKLTITNIPLVRFFIYLHSTLSDFLDKNTDLIIKIILIFISVVLLRIVTSRNVGGRTN